VGGEISRVDAVFTPEHQQVRWITYRVIGYSYSLRSNEERLTFIHRLAASVHLFFTRFGQALHHVEVPDDPPFLAVHIT
jgi:hypothetical protein